MKIIRNGNEIELTDTEIYQVWEYQQHLFDKEYIKERLGELLDDLEDEERDKILSDDEFVSKVTYQWRKYMDNQDNGDLE